jgi:hypothetical protein
MALPGDEDEQRQGFRLAFEAAPFTLDQIWMKYFAIGGGAGMTEVHAYVHGALSLPPIERDMLAHALNESLNGLGVNGRRAGYSQAICLKSDDLKSDEGQS